MITDVMLFPIFVRQGRSRTRFKVGYINQTGDVVIDPTSEKAVILSSQWVYRTFRQFATVLARKTIDSNHKVLKFMFFASFQRSIETVAVQLLLCPPDRYPGGGHGLSV